METLEFWSRNALRSFPNELNYHTKINMHAPQAFKLHRLERETSNAKLNICERNENVFNLSKSPFKTLLMRFMVNCEEDNCFKLPFVASIFDIPEKI